MELGYIDTLFNNILTITISSSNNSSNKNYSGNVWIMILDLKTPEKRLNNCSITPFLTEVHWYIYCSPSPLNRRRVRSGRHKQDWVDLTRPDFTATWQWNSTKNQSWKTLCRSRLGGTNRHLNEQAQRVEQQIGKDGSSRQGVDD